MWDPNQKRLVMVDFELVCIDNPMRDVGAYIGLRSQPKWRKKYEKELV